MQPNSLTTVSTALKPTLCRSKVLCMKSSTDRAHLGASSREHYTTLKQSAAGSPISFRKRRWEREFKGNWTYWVRLSKVISMLRNGGSFLWTWSWLTSSTVDIDSTKVDTMATMKVVDSD